ncbi:plasmid mobilization protein [Streptococcus suis]
MQEPKRPRGRPATGLVRDKKITIRTTAEEAELIKNKAKENGENLTNFIINLIKEK